MNTTSSILERALLCLARGLAPLPISSHGEGKAPYIKWAKYETTLPTKEEVEEWWSKYPNAKLGIVTGSVSGIVVVDVDPRNGGTASLKSLNLPPTYIVKTGGGGWHYYYRLPIGAIVPKFQKWKPGVDIQGERALVVAPPSLHKTGNLYEEVTDFNQLTDAPEWLLNLAQAKRGLAVRDVLNGVAEGGRNDAAAKVIGSTLIKMTPDLWQTIGWQMALEWNQKNKPPLSEKELGTVFKSIVAREENKRTECQTKDDRLRAFMQPIIDVSEFFVDGLGKPYVKIAVGDHKEVLRCGEKRLEALLMKEFSAAFGKIPSTEERKKMQSFLEAMAVMSGVKKDLRSRIALLNGELIYDLVTNDWEMVKVSREGCEVISEQDAYFKRTAYQAEQSTPDFKNGNAELLFKYLNLNTDEERKLLLVAIIVAFIPDIARPIFVFHGEQGTAKTTLSRICKSLIDPSAVDLLSLSSKEDDLVVALSRNYALFFDNVSIISCQIADVLCRAVTGGGVAKRKLYTDEEEAVFRFQRVVGINGINQIIDRPDLLERSLIFELKVIPPEERLDEEDYWAGFKNDLPMILGGVFNILGLALREKALAKPIKGLPRMADFGKWATIVSGCLGYGEGFFKQAYENNIAQQDAAVLEHPIVSALVKFMEQRERWEGSMSELLYALTHLPEEGWYRAGGTTLDVKANTLSRVIKRFQPHLRRIGISIQEIKQRRYLVTKLKAAT